ncbi:MAG: helix-turn-helix domain-containing protein [Clostridia bacterium]|nr:helix-turn-helix domain-containing protein [Clostridia bacterium]
MEPYEIIRNLRTEKGLSRKEVAEKVGVTAQTVYRWENGMSFPNDASLKRLSDLFGVSVDTICGSAPDLICQCCGMPLEDSVISREPDGGLNEDYCKWCYADGKFTYSSMEQLIDFCSEHLATESWPAEQIRAHMEATLPRLGHWKKS